jgi:hypothetical protein
MIGWSPALSATGDQPICMLLSSGFPLMTGALPAVPD